MILIAGKIVYFSMIRYLLTKWNLIRNLENHENEGRSANFHFQVGGVSLLGYVEKIFIFKGGGVGVIFQDEVDTLLHAMAEDGTV